MTVLDWVIYNEQKFIGLTVLESGKSKIKSFLVRVVLLLHNMVEGIIWAKDETKHVLL
jgi:hypothetical protein